MKKDVFTMFFLQFVRLISKPAVLLMIPLYLTLNEQGYWFTLISLGSLTVFVDLGLTNLILQFSSHQMSGIKFCSGTGVLIGDKTKLWKLSSLLRLVLKIIKFSLLAFPLLLFVIGSAVLSSDDASKSIGWLIPWAIFAFSVTLYFSMNLIFSFVEGLDQVSRINKLRVIQSLVNTLVVVSFLFFGFSLYALALSMLISCLIAISVFYFENFNFLKHLLVHSLNEQFNVKDKLLSLLKKTAISYISGYFIFQFFTPLIFIYFGSDISGKVGFSLSIIASIFGISIVWINVIRPKLNIFTAQGDRDKALKYLFYSTLLSALTYVTGVVMLFSLLKYELFSFLADRLVDNELLLILSIAWGVQVIINNIAIFVRSYLIEPFVYVSIVGALITVSVTLYFCFTMDVSGIFYGFMMSNILLLPIFIHEMRKTKYATL